MFSREKGAHWRMSGKIRQRGLLAIIIYFLMITAIWTPIGFYAGRARGETEASALIGVGKDLSHFETDRSGANRSDLYAPIIFLPGQTERLRLASSGNRVSEGPRREASFRQNPLREAVLQALANDAVAGGGAGSSSAESSNSQPFSLAMAPDPLGVGGTNSPFGAGGSVPGSGGFPGAIIPGFLSTTNPGNPATPGGEPPVLETPIPAALPMFLSGLAACWAAARRKRTR
jgi:hypothetical protein